MLLRNVRKQFKDMTNSRDRMFMDLEAFKARISDFAKSDIDDKLRIRSDASEAVLDWAFDSDRHFLHRSH